MKKLTKLGLGFLVAVSFAYMSCSSGDSKEGGDTAASTDENMQLENGGDFNKDATAANGDSAAATDPGAGSDPSAAPKDDLNAGLDDVPLDGSVDANKTAQAAPTDPTAAPPPGGDLDLGDPEHEFPEDVAKSQKEGVTPGPTDDQIFSQNTPPPADAGAQPPPSMDPSAGAPPPIVDNTTAAPTEPPIQAPPAEAPVVATVPYEKIKTEPYEKNGVWLNRVYLARAGDTAKSISTKIYGNDGRVKDLKSWNGSLKNHAPRVGDKVYYNSPKDPQDNTKMLILYEEQGVEPQKYVTKSGDDIRKVSKQLLGHKDSWKEIYATNANLENKSGKVQEGIELRYWPGDAVPQQLAQQPPPGPGGPPADPMNNPGNLPPDDPTIGQNQVPPPPAPAPPMPPGPGGPAVGTVQQPPAPPAPPPAVVDNQPPPPPVVDRPTKKPASPPQSVDASNDQETMFMLAGALAVVAAAAAFVVIRRQRAKRIDLSQQTQV